MTQDQALDILKTGGNVFLTGAPGAGKTHVLNHYIAWLEAAKLSVAVTASTGIAATHIGGMTIHAWSGIGILDEMTPQSLDKIMQKEKVVKRIKAADALVIDEISMLDGRQLEMVETVCRTARGNEEAFGGLQVVLVGDFFQLPPIGARGEVVRLAYESRAWDSMKPLVCYLDEQHRQDDEMLLSLLNSIRKNDIDESHYTLLQEQVDIAYEGVEPTRLFTHNSDVDALNDSKLRSLPSAGFRYTMNARGNKQLLQGLVKNCLSPEALHLKEDAMVMCTKNNFEVGYVNGTLGRIIRFSEERFPVIETSDGREITIRPVTWEIAEDGKVIAQIEQLPLRLAWAITVHKSQGMSLDAAEIDLSNAFVYGQGYVALSRVRTLDGLKMLGMHPNALQVDPKVIQADERFVSESDSAVKAFAAMDAEEIEDMHQSFVKNRGGTFPAGEVDMSPEARKKQFKERVQKESTTAVTLGLIKAGNSAPQIARERDMNLSTIWSHVEKLVEDGALTIADLGPLEPDGWIEIYAELQPIITKEGVEKLKPIYEAAGEKYDYDIIRLARLVYELEG